MTMTMRNLRWLGVLALCCGIRVSVTAQDLDGEAETMRVWTSRQGTQIEAEFVKLDGAFAVFRKRDGAMMKIFPRALSDVDQDLISRKTDVPLATLRQRAIHQEGKPVTPGIISDRIQADGRGDNTYMVYLPKDYTANRRWPAMVFFAHGGGDAEFLQSLVPAAELNGMIMAVSVTFKSSLGVSGETARGARNIVSDLRARWSVDPQRSYLAGTGEGARLATWAASRSDPGVAGLLLINGAEDLSNVSLNPRTLCYGICKGDAYYRWALSCMARDNRNRDSRLRFYAEGGQNTDCVSEGITWMNGCFLKAAGAGSPYEEERNRWAGAVLNLVGAAIDQKPERAIGWVHLLEEFTLPSQLQFNVTRYASMLRANPKALQHLAAEKEIGEFARKYLATDYEGQWREIPKQAVRDAEKLAERFRDTIYGPVFAQMTTPLKRN